MKKGILVADHPHNRNIALAKCEKHFEAVKQIVEVYKQMNLPPLKKGDLLPLFNNTKEFIYDKMLEGGLSLGNAAIKKAAAMEMVEYPAGYDALKKALFDLHNNPHYEQLGGTDPTRQPDFKFTNIEKVYEVDTDGNVFVEPDFMNGINEMGKYYAETEAAQAAYNFMKDVNDLFYKYGLDEHIKAANPIEAIASAFNKLDYKTRTFSVMQSRFPYGNFSFFPPKP